MEAHLPGHLPQDPREHRLARPSRPLTDGVVALRAWNDDDVEQIDAACQDPEIGRYIPIPSPYAPADAVRYIARTRRQWDEGVKAAFAIVEADAPAVVLGAINMAVSGATGNAAYWLAPGVRGWGFAARALRLLTEWAFAEVGLGVVILEIHPANAASQRVAAAAGFHEAGHLEHHTDGGSRNMLIFSRLAAS